MGGGGEGRGVLVALAGVWRGGNNEPKGARLCTQRISIAGVPLQQETCEGSEFQTVPLIFLSPKDQILELAGFPVPGPSIAGRFF